MKLKSCQRLLCIFIKRCSFTWWISCRLQYLNKVVRQYRAKGHRFNTTDVRWGSLSFCSGKICNFLVLPRQLNCKMFALIPGECYQQTIWQKRPFRAFKILHLKHKTLFQKAFHMFMSSQNFVFGHNIKRQHCPQPVHIQIIRLFYKHFTPFGPSPCSLKGCGFHWTWEKQFYKVYVLMFSFVACRQVQW